MNGCHRLTRNIEDWIIWPSEQIREKISKSGMTWPKEQNLNVKNLSLNGLTDITNSYLCRYVKRSTYFTVCKTLIDRDALILHFLHTLSISALLSMSMANSTISPKNSFKNAFCHYKGSKNSNNFWFPFAIFNWLIAI